MELLAILIFVSAIAFRGASMIMHNIISNNVLQVPLAYMRPPGRTIVQAYMFLAVPMALANGFLLEYSWIDALIAGFGTWAGMLFANIFLRFNEIFQFLVFGLVTVGWLIFNIYKAIT